MGKIIKKIAAFLAGIAIVAALACGGLWFFRENYVTVNGRILWRHSSVVDLNGHDLNQLDFLHSFTRLKTIDARGCEMTVEQYEHLRKAFPASDIAWDVPFQGRRYSTQTQKITVTSLSEEDLKLLDYLPELKSVDGWDCEDYPQLLRLQQRRPLCKVFYDVEIAGKNWDCDLNELQLEDVDLPELSRKLQYLPRVQTLHLSGELPRMTDLQKLLEKYPKVALSWQVDVGETVLELGATYLDLSGFPLRSAQDVERLIPYLPALEEVNLTGCGISAEAVVSLARRYPEVQFLYEVSIGAVTVRTDAYEIDISGQVLSDVSEIESLLPCFHNLEKVVMCGCGIDSEDMDALNQRHPDIRFVWSVDLGGLEVRTDATYFVPTKYDVKVSNADLKELKYCVDMVCVDVGHMKYVTRCDWAAHMPNLKYLIMADTGVRDITPLTGLKNLVFLELFLAPVKDYSPLLTCTALEDLNLCYTHGNPEPVTQMTWLKRLWWAGSWTARVKYKDAWENIPDCTFNFVTESSTGEGWRNGKNYYAMRDLIGMSYMTW